MNATFYTAFFNTLQSPLKFLKLEKCSQLEVKFGFWQEVHLYYY